MAKDSSSSSSPSSLSSESSSSSSSGNDLCLCVMFHNGMSDPYYYSVRDMEHAREAVAAWRTNGGIWCAGRSNKGDEFVPWHAVGVIQVRGKR